MNAHVWEQENNIPILLSLHPFFQSTTVSIVHFTNTFCIPRLFIHSITKHIKIALVFLRNRFHLLCGQQIEILAEVPTVFQQHVIRFLYAVYIGAHTPSAQLVFNDEAGVFLLSFEFHDVVIVEETGVAFFLIRAVPVIVSTACQNAADKIL